MRIPPSVTGLRSAARWVAGGALRRLTGRLVSGAELRVSTTARPAVCLTFDDGPDLLDAEILEVLQRYQARATFFVLGEAICRHPAQLAAMAAAGHELGVHGHSHAAVDQMSANEIHHEITACRTRIARAAPEAHLRWYRPPYGRMRTTAVEAAQQSGLEPILWTVDPQDWRHAVETAEITDRVLAGVRPGSVVLLHSTSAATAAALPGILAGLATKGLSAVTLSELADA